MLLVSSGRLSALQRQTQQASREGTTTLPALRKSSPARKTNSHRRGSISRQIDPAFLDAFYNEQEEPAKEEEEEKPEENQVDEEMERAVASACVPFASEQSLAEDKKALIAGMREEMKLQAPHRAQVLTVLRTLVDAFVKDIRAREAEVGEARKAVHVIQAEHTAETKHLHKELTSRSAAASELERKLLGATSQIEELKQHVAQLEETLSSASAVGMTAADAARTVAQLAKARASVEGQKKQIAALEGKVQALEHNRRQEESDMREREKKSQKELKETLRQYGPERVKELASKLDDATTELNLVRGHLRTAQVAQKQQHKLVVSWRIKVEDITKLLSEQDERMADQVKELQARAESINDLKTQLSQAESDVKKTMNQLTQMNRKVNEYLDKYTRQAAYIKQQEAHWKALEAQRMLDEMESSHSHSENENG